MHPKLLSAMAAAILTERYPLRTMGPGSARAIHHMVEAARRAYADRAMHLGDADHTALGWSAIFRHGLGQAVSQPRFHHQWQPDRILFEPGVSDETVSALRSMRHRGVVILPAARPGNANSIMRIRGALWGFADPRSPGVAAGI